MADFSLSKPHLTASRDLDQLLAHTSLKVAQSFALIVPPIYLVSLAVRRKPFSVAKLMRTTWMWTAGGAAASVPAAYWRLKNEPDYALSDRTFRLKENASQVRVDDYSFIGSALGALLVPTLFLRRAALLNLVLGGAAFGLAGGVIAHLGKQVGEGQEVAPKGMVAEVDVGKVTRKL